MNYPKFRIIFPGASLRAYLGAIIAGRAVASVAIGKRVALANEAQVPVIGLANDLDLAAHDGWLRVPYGEWSYGDGINAGIQRFGRAQAEAMVGYYRNVWNRIKRAVVGTSIFRGHPDHPAFANQHKDKATYGTVADMEARDDGLYLRPVLTETGAALVEKEGLSSVSPHWLANELPAENGRRVFAPTYLVSLGLTANPNIPGISLVNAIPDFSEPMKDHVLKLLAALGNSLPATATDEQLTSGLDAAVQTVSALKQRPEASALANEQTAKATLETKLAEAQTAMANERKAHATTLVDAAVREGRITEAQKPVWQSRLERDFASESAALANEQPAIKTKSSVGNLGPRKEGEAPMVAFVSLVNEALPRHGNDWSAAWAATKATKQGAELLGLASKQYASGQA